MIKEGTVDKIQPGSVIIFNNLKSEKPVDETGCNQIGVFLNENCIVFSQDNKAIELSYPGIEKISDKILAYPIADRALKKRIIGYFQLNKKNAHLIKLGITSFMSPTKYIIFDNPNIMPYVKDPLSPEVHNKSWKRIIPKLEIADSIFSFNTKSLISRLITSIDIGSWSHVGIYLGDGMISEAVASGVMNRDIDIYNKHHIRLGVYRIIGLTEKQRTNIIKFAVESVGVKYYYRGVLRLGLRKIFHKDFVPKEPRDFSPNGLIYSGILYLVDYV